MKTEKLEALNFGTTELNSTEQREITGGCLWAAIFGLAAAICALVDYIVEHKK
jgi:hypothetical protein